MRISTQKVTCHLDPVVTWQLKNVIFSQPQGLRPPKLADGTQVEESSRTKPNDNSISRSCYKHVIFSLSHGLWSVAVTKDERYA